MTLSFTRVFFYRMNDALRLSTFLKHTFKKDNFYRYVIEMFLFCRLSKFNLMFFLDRYIQYN